MLTRPTRAEFIWYELLINSKCLCMSMSYLCLFDECLHFAVPRIPYCYHWFFSGLYVKSVGKFSETNYLYIYKRLKNVPTWKIICNFFLVTTTNAIYPNICTLRNLQATSQLSLLAANDVGSKLDWWDGDTKSLLDWARQNNNKQNYIDLGSTGAHVN